MSTRLFQEGELSLACWLRDECVGRQRPWSSEVRAIVRACDALGFALCSAEGPIGCFPDGRRVTVRSRPRHLQLSFTPRRANPKEAHFLLTLADLVSRNQASPELA